MAPFDFSRAGFCMEFRYASFVLSCPGVDLRSPDRILGPQVNILAWGRFGVNFGVPKNILLRGNYFVVGIQGNPSCPNEFYGPWDPFGCTTLAKTNYVLLFSGDFKFSWKTGARLARATCNFLGKLETLTK